MKDLDIVIVNSNIPNINIKKGDTGTIVYTHNNGEAFEVEFIENGKTTGVHTIRREFLTKWKK